MKIKDFIGKSSVAPRAKKQSDDAENRDYEALHTLKEYVDSRFEVLERHILNSNSVAPDRSFLRPKLSESDDVGESLNPFFKVKKHG